MVSLIITEKPKVAEKVAAALSENGVKRKQRFNVSYFEVERRGKKLLIAPAVGHIYTLKQESSGSGYPVFNVVWAPVWQVEKGARFTKDYLQLLESLGKECDEFINSCDYDVEGSLIGANVIRFACKAKLENAKRMRFSALTKEDLVEAYENMGLLDVNNALAGETRHMLDWFWGINLSRALMHAIRGAGVYKVLSIGRVQGPALNILATREHEIAKFKPEPYWQLYATCNKVRFIHIKEKFFKKEEAEAARANSEANKENAIVEKVSRTEKKVPPNPPFDLTSLQVEAFKCFGFSPALTLELAQALYEASLISYPRTSSQKLPAKLNLPKILNSLSTNPAYTEKAKALLSAGKTKPYEGKKEDPAHPAIHPTGLMPKEAIGEKELKLYDLIVKRFLACFADWAVREGMRVDLALGPEKYYVSGARTVSPGWISFYEPYAKFEEEMLPDFKEGERLKVSKIEMPQKETTPPKRYTEASIIQALEKDGLGTKATRAVVIETLHERGYIRGKKSIEVTPFGLAVHAALAKHCPEILDKKLTREFEELMEAVADGKTTEENVIKEGKETLEAILSKFKKNETAIGSSLAGVLTEQRREAETLGKCPKCGGNMMIKRGIKSGKQFAACSEYPKCTNTYPLPQNALIVPTQKICEKCGTPIYIVRRKGMKDYEMCLDPKCPSKQAWGKQKKSGGDEGGTQAKANSG